MESASKQSFEAATHRGEDCRKEERAATRDSPAMETGPGDGGGQGLVVEGSGRSGPREG